MPNLRVQYMGLSLSSPLVAASSPFTGKLPDICALAEAGASAIVLRSIFEEQIRSEVQDMETALDLGQHAEVYEYLRADLPMQIGPEHYLQLIRDAKKSVQIPIVASINCISPGQWPTFAHKVEIAGADALELNVYDIPASGDELGVDVEKRHLEMVRSVCVIMRRGRRLLTGHKIAPKFWLGNSHRELATGPIPIPNKAVPAERCVRTDPELLWILLGVPSKQQIDPD